MTESPRITGIGSVSPYGPRAGAVEGRPLSPRPISTWPVTATRRAYLVEPFRPTDVVPGLKTRRLDRLSVWSLVAGSLAIQDAGLDLGSLDRSRVAVVLASGLGCVELTESYFKSAGTNGWAKTDPILFPEPLGNSPAAHVARHLDLRGPNVTLSSVGFGGECALLHAAGLLRRAQADYALVLCGDTLTRTVYEWYETAGLLSPACFGDVAEGGGFVPAEGMVAMLLEGGERRSGYACLRSGRFAAAPEADGIVGAADPVASGLRDSGALLRLAVALHDTPAGASLLLRSSAPNGGVSTLHLERPA
jgi:3-oxoacyl-(acyl-carrier-protein) synthase